MIFGSKSEEEMKFKYPFGANQGIGRGRPPRGAVAGRN